MEVNEFVSAGELHSLHGRQKLLWVFQQELMAVIKWSFRQKNYVISLGVDRSKTPTFSVHAGLMADMTYVTYVKYELPCCGAHPPFVP